MKISSPSGNMKYMLHIWYNSGTKIYFLFIERRLCCTLTSSFRQCQHFCSAAYIVMLSRCATDGIDSPCWLVVVDIRAPVAQNSIFLNDLWRSCSKTYEHSTVAAQPQPDAPAFTFCFLRSNIISPQSLCLSLMFIFSLPSSSYKRSEPILAKSPVRIRS